MGVCSARPIKDSSKQFPTKMKLQLLLLLLFFVVTSSAFTPIGGGRRRPKPKPPQPQPQPRPPATPPTTTKEPHQPFQPHWGKK
ncbi:unnamed protein product [Caenorhabditis auriculariae]|uniref:Uncharacterized protein n=1 Tax=Caenorhabditis auriculariae TaxID=2777116 RepID=A0A8S1HNW6_9PELO|nr:unnamed protein product [Caenorhabditis auriculariae]